MERKYFVAAALLSALLLGGIFVLIRQNGGLAEMGANLVNGFNGRGGEWVQIQPRTSPDNGITNSIKESEAISLESGSNNAKKEKLAPVKWCDAAVAANEPQGNVIINEIAWMGTAASYSDEWIELKNLSSMDINLNGWQLQNKNGKLKIAFGSGDIISARAVYLMERTADDTVPGIVANKIYTGNLGNSNEALYLFDDKCRIQDMAAAAPKWPAGDNTAKLTMNRLADLSWANSAAGGGTPGR